MIAEHRAQPRRGQRLSTMGALGDDEQCISVGFGAFGQQIGLDRAGDVGVDRHRPFLAALTEHPNPPPRNVDIADPQPEHLRRPQTRQQHQPTDRAVTPATEAAQQRRGLLPRQSARQPARLTDPQLRPRFRLGHMRQQPGTLTARTQSGRPPATDRATRVRVTHLPEREQARNRRQPPIDRRRRIPLTAAVANRIHISPRPTRQRRLPTRGQEPQQHIDIHLRQGQLLIIEPP